MRILQDYEVLREISESLSQIANNTKKEKKEPKSNYLVNLTWVALGLAIVYILWKVQNMAW